jgi:hypothetical protein
MGTLKKADCLEVDVGLFYKNSIEHPFELSTALFTFCITVAVVITKKGEKNDLFSM